MDDTFAGLEFTCFIFMLYIHDVERVMQIYMQFNVK